MSEVRPTCILGLKTVRRTVRDIARSVDFYCKALGFTFPPGNDASMTLGSEFLTLVTEPNGSSNIPCVAGPDVRFAHFAIVTADFAAALARLQCYHHVAITRGGPQHLPAPACGVTAFKFRDPDGHPLELLHFSPGVGAARWHDGNDKGVTLGIDHVAISVADVERSIAFYTHLGMTVVSRQVNRGAEQARLDGLPEAVVEVVALQPRLQPTPHLELLGYVVPPTQASCGGDRARPQIGDCIVFAADGCQQNKSYCLRDPDGHLFQIEPY